MNISLRDVTKDNWLDVIHLEITKEQENYVALNSESIAESSFYPHYVNRAIYRDNEVVGFIQFYQELEEGLPDEFYIAQFMVDVKYQGQGIGKIATKQVISEMSAIPECKKITILYMPGHHAMRKFYSQFGFKVTEEDENDGVVMELDVVS
ncbi:Spermine/spermidine acetyltransferase [Paraglaciecola mesophila]|uniref:Spermine/spermidine acetyltransferase n=1 Tax=Paraglaciecola mesophila TaxID=197222 RepID=A0A857JT80_9ALTE|nr:GNAT family N-acetyltransferase [Paraglaciecola mesophila]QHJ13904.1 Spermine/spermidine acetyltransferase [Paraglaciecola mesophila]